jgi:DNA-binding MarR family transcriptional regulator
VSEEQMADPLTRDELATFSRLVDIGTFLDRQGELDMRSRSGLSGLQYEILVRLRNAGGQLRMNELADVLVHAPSTLTYQVRQLQKLGYVLRARDSGDERAVLAKLTQSGLEFVRSQRGARAELIRQCVASSLTPRELSQLAKLLAKVQQGLRGVVLEVVLADEAEQLLPTVLSVGGSQTVRRERHSSRRSP